MSMKCPACGKNHWGHCTDKSVPLWKRMIAGEYDDGDRYLSESRKAVSARIFAREVNQLERKCAALEAENKRLKDLCQRWNVTAGHFAAGSEFINDPERVLEVLKAREEGRRRLSEVKERKHAEEVSRLRSQLELVRERLGGTPEINPCNYDHDEVVELSSACILAYFLAGGKPTNEEVPEYKQAQAELLDAALGRQV